MGIINEEDRDFDKNGAGRVVGITVEALREALAELPADNLVVLSKDAEGNGFSPLATVEFDGMDGGTLYRAESTWRGEIRSPKARKEAEEEGYDPEDLEADDVASCIVLWPIN